MSFVALTVSPATPAAPVWMLAELERFSDRRWALPALPPVADVRYLLDVGGMQSVLGTPAVIARAIIAHFKTLGIDVRTGLGATRTAALLATGPGSSSKKLADLPVEALTALAGCGDKEGPVDVAAGIAIFHRWGLRHLGEIAALPVDAVTERLGREGTLLHRWARASDAGLRLPSPDAVLAPEPEITRAQTFEPALADTAALLAWLEREFTAAAIELDRTDGAVEAVALTLTLEDGARVGRVWRWEQRLISPHRDPRRLLRQVENALATCASEADSPENPGGIAAVQLKLELGRPRRLQAGLFGDAEAERERDERLVARLRAILGDVDGQRVGSAELLDLHRGDAFRMTPFGGTTKAVRGEQFSVSSEARLSTEGALCLRAARPPVQLPVAGCRLPVARTSEAPWSSPFVVRIRGRRIERAAGPWRSSGLWWSGRAWSRDEWDVETEDGDLYRLAHDRRARQWLLLGTYD